MIRNTTQRFGLVTKTLHWLLAASIFGLVALGWYMVGLTYYDPWYNGSLALHKSAGMLVLGMAAVFIVWWALNPRPEYPASLSPSGRVLARGTHGALLCLMALVPVSGYLISTAAGKPVEVFSVLEIPALFDLGDDGRELAEAVHYWTAYGIGVLALAHAAAALKHQLIDRDGTLARMIWR